MRTKCAWSKFSVGAKKPHTDSGLNLWAIHKITVYLPSRDISMPSCSCTSRSPALQPIYVSNLRLFPKVDVGLPKKVRTKQSTLHNLGKKDNAKPWRWMVGSAGRFVCFCFMFLHGACQENTFPRNFSGRSWGSRKIRFSHCLSWKNKNNNKKTTTKEHSAPCAMALVNTITSLAHQVPKYWRRIFQFPCSPIPYLYWWGYFRDKSLKACRIKDKYTTRQPTRHDWPRREKALQYSELF